MFYLCVRIDTCCTQQHISFLTKLFLTYEETEKVYIMSVFKPAHSFADVILNFSFQYTIVYRLI